jgi:hypothetical protein
MMHLLNLEKRAAQHFTFGATKKEAWKLEARQEVRLKEVGASRRKGTGSRYKFAVPTLFIVADYLGYARAI